jgi:putative aldouronate transport system substrate-binding protein
MKEALSYLNKLFKEKLIDNEYATNDAKIWEQRLTTETAGSTWDTFTRQDYFNKPLEKVNPKAHIQIMLPLKGADGVYTKSQQLAVADTGAAISSSSKYKVELAKWADWFYSPEGNMIYNFGILGETYTMENGEPKYTDLILKDPKLTPGSKIISLGRHHFNAKLDIRYENAAVAPEVAKLRDDVSNAVKEKFPIEYLSYTPAERDQLNAKLTEINTYRDEMMNKFVYGAESLDKFDDFVAKVNKIGLADVLKVQQAAYDRYSKR